MSKSHQWPCHSLLLKILNLGIEDLISYSWVTPLWEQLVGEGFWLTDSLWMNVSNIKDAILQWRNQMLLVKRTENRCSTSRMLTSSKVTDQEKGWQNGKRNDLGIKCPGVQICNLLLSSYYMEILLHSPEVCSQEKWIYTN